MYFENDYFQELLRAGKFAEARRLVLQTGPSQGGSGRAARISAYMQQIAAAEKKAAPTASQKIYNTGNTPATPAGRSAETANEGKPINKGVAPQTPAKTIMPTTAPQTAIPNYQAARGGGAAVTNTPSGTPVTNTPSSVSATVIPQNPSATIIGTPGDIYGQNKGYGNIGSSGSALNTGQTILDRAASPLYQIVNDIMTGGSGSKTYGLLEGAYGATPEQLSQFNQSYRASVDPMRARQTQELSNRLAAMGLGGARVGRASAGLQRDFGAQDAGVYNSLVGKQMDSRVAFGQGLQGFFQNALNQPLAAQGALAGQVGNMLTTEKEYE